MRLIFKSVPKLIWPRNRISLLRRAARFSSLRHYVTEKAWESCNSRLQALERRTAWRWRGTRRSRRTSRRTYLYGKNALLARQLDKRRRVSDLVEQHVLIDFQICLSVTLLDRISYSRFHDLIKSYKIYYFQFRVFSVNDCQNPKGGACSREQPGSVRKKLLMGRIRQLHEARMFA